MKKLTLILTMFFVLGCFCAVMAQEKEMTGTALVEPITKGEVLRLELDVLQAQGQAKANELQTYLTQIEFLKLKIPAVQAKLNELNAQIRKKVTEINEAERPVVEKPAAPEPKKE